MLTVNELKKLSGLELSEAINLNVINTRKLREAELNNGYLERHPETKEVPDFIISSSEELALHFAIGSLQGCLSWAIFMLKTAEAALESQKV